MSKTIDTFEINGKMIELSELGARTKKVFESKKHYYYYLENIVKKYYPESIMDEEKLSYEEYDEKLEKYTNDLWNVVNEKNNNKKGTNSEKKAFSYLKGAIFHPIKTVKNIIGGSINLLIVKPVKFVCKKGVNLLKTINSKMPWKKEKIDADKLLEDAIESYNDNEKAEEILNEAEQEENNILNKAKEELSHGVTSEMAQETEERLKNTINKLNEQLEELKQQFRELQEEKENTIKNIEANAKNELDDNRYKSLETNTSFVLNDASKNNISQACRMPYVPVKTAHLIKLTNEDIEKYRQSRIIDMNEDTVTISGDYYHELLRDELGYIRDITEDYLSSFPEEKDNIQIVRDYNYDGLISREKGKNERGLTYNVSCTITRKRYDELMNTMDEVFKRNAEKCNRVSAKKLVK